MIGPLVGPRASWPLQFIPKGKRSIELLFPQTRPLQLGQESFLLYIIWSEVIILSQAGTDEGGSSIWRMNHKIHALASAVKYYYCRYFCARYARLWKGTCSWWSAAAAKCTLAHYSAEFFLSFKKRYIRIGCAIFPETFLRSNAAMKINLLYSHV